MARRQRLEDALQAIKKPGGVDISHVLLPEEFAEARQAANLAAENKLAAMLNEAKAAVEVMLP